MYNPQDKRSLEKYSSATTLSDMEIFIFPELIYALVLANIMSPIIWSWKSKPWFKENDSLNDYRRVLRVKQFIMDSFLFNLDLDTWGLTTKEKELARFSEFINPSILSQSNALFGYEGDKYYFDIDIRRHFGLDKYNDNIIPYWKTETIEAMAAFVHKTNYVKGAGECVSLSTLYAASMFILGHIPLEKIYLLATPLHSQNFIDIKDGILTNNRRIVTKSMWFNGTEISAKARRALEHEQVTLVMNNLGFIHTMYDHATMPQPTYTDFSTKLNNFLKTDITFDVIASFLRQSHSLQKCFQISHHCCGKPRFIEAEKAFYYENNSKSRIGDATQNNLLLEIDEDEFYTQPLQGRIILNQVEAFFKTNQFPIDSPQTMVRLKEQLCHSCFNVDEVITNLMRFCKTQPRLPTLQKEWVPEKPLKIDIKSSREEVIAYLESVRTTHPVADLAFMALRNMSKAPWKPFIKASLERSPVSIAGSHDFEIPQVFQKLTAMENISIYDETTRIAQPDEVWNFNRGDGLEKALCLYNILLHRFPQNTLILDGDGKTISVKDTTKKTEYLFATTKQVPLPQPEDFKDIH